MKKLLDGERIVEKPRHMSDPRALPDLFQSIDLGRIRSSIGFQHAGGFCKTMPRSVTSRTAATARVEQQEGLLG